MDGNFPIRKLDKWRQLEDREIINGATENAQWCANATYSKWAHTHRTKRKSERDRQTTARPSRVCHEPTTEQWRADTAETRTPRPIRLPPLDTRANCLTAQRPADTPRKLKSEGKLKTSRRHRRISSPVLRMPHLTKEVLPIPEDDEDSFSLESLPNGSPGSAFEMPEIYHEKFPPLFQNRSSAVNSLRMPQPVARRGLLHSPWPHSFGINTLTETQGSKDNKNEEPDRKSRVRRNPYDAMRNKRFQNNDT